MKTNLWGDIHNRCHTNFEHDGVVRPPTPWRVVFEDIGRTSRTIDGELFEIPTDEETDGPVGEQQIADSNNIVDEEEFGELNREETKREIEESGFEALAWYAPIHFYGVAHWGIYIHEARFFGLCSLLTDRLGKEHWNSIVVDLHRSIMRHESFHSLVELFALVLEDFNCNWVDPNCPYYRYFSEVYRKTWPQKDCTEEGIATALQMRTHFTTPGFFDGLREIISTGPPAYANWNSYSSPQKLHQGTQELAYKIVEIASEASSDKYKTHFEAKSLFAGKYGNIWFPDINRFGHGQFDAVPVWIYRQGNTTTHRVALCLDNFLMRKFIRTLEREFGAIDQKGGGRSKEHHLKFANGKKVAYSKSAKRVPHYLPKEIASALEIPIAEFNQRCFGR